MGRLHLQRHLTTSLMTAPSMFRYRPSPVRKHTRPRRRSARANLAVVTQHRLDLVVAGRRPAAVPAAATLAVVPAVAEEEVMTTVAAVAAMATNATNSRLPIGSHPRRRMTRMRACSRPS